MSTRCPAQVKRTAVTAKERNDSAENALAETSRFWRSSVSARGTIFLITIATGRRWSVPSIKAFSGGAAAPPAAGLALVRPAEERERRAEQDLQRRRAASGARRTRRRARSAPPTAATRAPVDLRPAGDARASRRAASAGAACTARPGRRASAAARSGSSRRGRRSRAAAARRARAAGATRPTRVIRGSPRLTAQPGTLLLRADDHRPQLQQLELARRPSRPAAAGRARARRRPA